jgi:SAM-dependent methyltransferase
VRDTGNANAKSVGVAWKEGRQTLWRRHSDAVNVSMLMRWLPERRLDLVLKTDLFDEMSGEGLFSLLSQRARRFAGIDVSGKTLKIACARHTGLCGIVADVRKLPFRKGVFEAVVSNSTLDHFEKHEAISQSLDEIRRVLRQDGQLIITMDNLANPVVALRNSLPARLLRKMYLTPYFVGATWGPRGLRRQLVRTGFHIVEMDAALHCPRVLAVAAAFIVERLGPPRMQKAFLRALFWFEVLRFLPTRFLTGHFVAVKAVKIGVHKVMKEPSDRA